MLNKKKITTIFILLLLILAFIWFPKNYEEKYKIKKYTVVEKYIKKDKMYYFKITNDKKTYETISYKDYTPKRKLINSIKKYKNHDTSCIIIDSKKIDNNIICLQNEKKIDYNLIDILPKKYYKKYEVFKSEYKNINGKYVDDRNYFVWNYKGFIQLNKNKKSVIKLFKNDTYDINIVTTLDKYLVIADYNEQYNFNKLYKINMENNKVDEIELNEDISFDSKIIGTHKNSIYLIDEKNKKEYEINIKKETIDVISKNKMGQVYQNGKWVKIKLNKIITDNITFKEEKYNTYKVNNELYLYQKNIKKPTKISNKDIKTIVYQDEEEVYYISKDSLYKYDFKHGENEILNYFELNFNYNNMIFVY